MICGLELGYAQNQSLDPFDKIKKKSSEELLEEEVAESEELVEEEEESEEELAENEEDPDDFEPIDEILEKKPEQKKPEVEYARPQEPEALPLPPLEPEPLRTPEPEVVYATEADQEPAQKQAPSFQAGSVNVGGPEKSILVPHPNAAKGLNKIRRDGSYIYSVKPRETSRSSTIHFSSLLNPNLSRTVGSQTITFEDLYGSALFGFTANYEWLPFRKFGTLGLVFESGLSFARGNGRFSDGIEALEEYTFLVAPLSVFAKYRFAYTKRQLFVPYIYGGGTYYLFFEIRDDGASRRYVGAPAIGGGGGIQMNMTRVDPESAMRLDRDFGIGEMWITADARFMQGLSTDIDMSNLIFSLGITLDY